MDRSDVSKHRACFAGLPRQPTGDTCIRVGSCGTLFHAFSLTHSFSSALEEEAEVGRGPVGDWFLWGKPWLVASPFNICLLSDANIMTNTLGCCQKEETRAHQSLPSRELKLFCASSEV